MKKLLLVALLFFFGCASQGLIEKPPKPAVQFEMSWAREPDPVEFVKKFEKARAEYRKKMLKQRLLTEQWGFYGYGFSFWDLR